MFERTLIDLIKSFDSVLWKFCILPHQWDHLGGTSGLWFGKFWRSLYLSDSIYQRLVDLARTSDRPLEEETISLINTALMTDAESASDMGDCLRPHHLPARSSGSQNDGRSRPPIHPEALHLGCDHYSIDWCVWGDFGRSLNAQCLPNWTTILFIVLSASHFCKFSPHPPTHSPRMEGAFPKFLAPWERYLGWGGAKSGCTRSFSIKSRFKEVVCCQLL